MRLNFERSEVDGLRRAEVVDSAGGGGVRSVGSGKHFAIGGVGIDGRLGGEGKRGRGGDGERGRGGDWEMERKGKTYILFP